MQQLGPSLVWPEAVILLGLQAGVSLQKHVSESPT